MKSFLRRRREDQGGFTLVEVTLTLLILSIVMLMAFDFLDRASILTMRTQANAQTEQDAQLALRVVTEHLRGADPIGDPCTPTMDTVASGPLLPAGYNNCIQFTVKRTQTGLDACAKTEFVFAIVGSGEAKTLVENRREFTGTGAGPPTCNPTTWRKRRVLLEKVANNTTGLTPEHFFTYYSATGNPIAPDDTLAVKQAASVRLKVAVRFNNKAARSVFTSSAALRNNISR